MKPALRLVKDVPAAAAPGERLLPGVPDRVELILVAALFLVNLVPVASVVAGVGAWSPATAGFAAGALLLTGRELWSQLRSRRRANIAW